MKTMVCSVEIKCEDHDYILYFREWCGIDKPDYTKIAKLHPFEVIALASTGYISLPKDLVNADVVGSINPQDIIQISLKHCGSFTVPKLTLTLQAINGFRDEEFAWVDPRNEWSGSKWYPFYEYYVDDDSYMIKEQWSDNPVEGVPFW